MAEYAFVTMPFGLPYRVTEIPGSDAYIVPASVAPYGKILDGNFINEQMVSARNHHSEETSIFKAIGPECMNLREIPINARFKSVEFPLHFSENNLCT